jgi:hypothetical protein
MKDGDSMCPSCGHTRKRHDVDSFRCVAPNKDDATIDCACTEFLIDARTRETVWIETVASECPHCGLEPGAEPVRGTLTGMLEKYGSAADELASDPNDMDVRRCCQAQYNRLRAVLTQLDEVPSKALLRDAQLHLTERNSGTVKRWLVHLADAFADPGLTPAQKRLYAICDELGVDSVTVTPDEAEARLKRLDALADEEALGGE